MTAREKYMQTYGCDVPNMDYPHDYDYLPALDQDTCFR